MKETAIVYTGEYHQELLRVVRDSGLLRMGSGVYENKAPYAAFPNRLKDSPQFTYSAHDVHSDYSTYYNVIRCKTIDEFVDTVKYHKKKQITHPRVRINQETVEFSDDGGHIDVGCTTVSFERVETIYRHMRKLREGENGTT